MRDPVPLDLVVLLLGNLTVWLLALAPPAWLTVVIFAWHCWSCDRLLFVRA